jgi:hypothetical protein
MEIKSNSHNDLLPLKIEAIANRNNSMKMTENIDTKLVKIVCTLASLNAVLVIKIAKKPPNAGLKIHIRRVFNNSSKFIPARA